MKSWILLIGGIAAGFYLLILAYLFFFQRSLLFHPTHERRAVKGWALELPSGPAWVEVRNPGKKLGLIYFPGNSEHWWEDPDDLAKLLPGHTIYFPHYPGYGASEGSPSQVAFYAMANALYDALIPRHDALDLIGRSLGSGVALHLAARRPVRRLVLITPYDSIASLGAERYPIFPVRSIIKDPFDALADASKITRPVWILLADRDRVIPHDHSFRLLEAFTRTKPQHTIISGTDHGDIVDSPLARESLRNFLESERASSTPFDSKDAKMRQKLLDK